MVQQDNVQIKTVSLSAIHITDSHDKESLERVEVLGDNVALHLMNFKPPMNFQQGKNYVVTIEEET